MTIATSRFKLKYHVINEAGHVLKGTVPIGKGSKKLDKKHIESLRAMATTSPTLLEAKGNKTPKQMETLKALFDVTATLGHSPPSTIRYIIDDLVKFFSRNKKAPNKTPPRGTTPTA